MDMGVSLVFILAILMEEEEENPWMLPILTMSSSAVNASRDIIWLYSLMNDG
jgi:hypothetical protein